MERSAIRDSPLARSPRISLRSIRATLDSAVQSAQSIRPGHLEHGLGPNLKIVTLAAGAHDRARHRGLVNAVLDEGLVDMDGDDLAEGKPGLRLLAVGALQLNDLCQFAFEPDRAFRATRHPVAL